MNQYLQHRRKEAGEVLSGFLGELVEVYDRVHSSQDHLGGLPYSRNDEIFSGYLASRPDISLEDLVAEKRADDLARHFLQDPAISTSRLGEFRMATSKFDKPNAPESLKIQALVATVETAWPSKFVGDGWSAEIPTRFSKYFFDQFEEAKLQDEALFRISHCPNGITLVGVVALEIYAGLITGEVHVFSRDNEFVRIDIAGIFNVNRYWRYAELSEFFGGVEAWKGFIETFSDLSPCSRLNA